MIIYLHGFDATSPGNHEKIMQLKFIDTEVRLVHYSTVHPKYDMSHILGEVHKYIQSSDDKAPLICGVGLGGFWSERIGFLCGIKQVIFDPNLFPEDNMVGKIEWPEEYLDIKSKCVLDFRKMNQKKCLCILSSLEDSYTMNCTKKALLPYYPIILDAQQGHKFKDIAHHLQRIKAFKLAP